MMLKNLCTALGLSAIAFSAGACMEGEVEVDEGDLDLDSEEEPEGLPDLVDGSDVNVRDVCFTVHDPGDPTAYTVRGKLFSTSAFRSSKTALLLQHGGFAEQSSWNGGKPAVSEAGRMAPGLTANGRGVFTVDRLGYATSPFPGGGYNLNGHDYTAMTAEMVTQIRLGTYKFAKNGSCTNGTSPSFGNKKIVLVGYSAGAAINEYYATQNSDISGVVSLAWSDQGASSIFGGLFNDIIIPQLNAGADYVYPVNPEADGYSERCELAFFYKPGMNLNALKQLCGPKYYLNPAKNKSPAGEVISVLDFQADIRAAAAGIGDTPLLKLYADKDNLLTNATWRGPSGTEPDLVTPDVQMWDAAASDFDWGFSLNAGHNSWFAKSANGTVTRIVNWMGARGL